MNFTHIKIKTVSYFYVKKIIGVLASHNSCFYSVSVHLKPLFLNLSS